MGYGQYSGKQSVHWSVTHEDDKGQAVEAGSADGAVGASDQGP